LLKKLATDRAVLRKQHAVEREKTNKSFALEVRVGTLVVDVDWRFACAQASKLQKKLKEDEGAEHKEYKRKQKDKRASSGDAGRELQCVVACRASLVVVAADTHVARALADGTI
jgi:hypothetical protein